jgi:hypothetical protein
MHTDRLATRRQINTCRARLEFIQRACCRLGQHGEWAFDFRPMTGIPPLTFDADRVNAVCERLSRSGGCSTNA